LRVEILSVTRGEGGEVGEPPVTSQERLGEVREAELRCAAEALGAAGVTFLPFVDPLVAATGVDPAPPSALLRIDAPPAALDLAPELLDAKERAALCHRSQHALFRRRRQARTVREVLLPWETLRRQALRPGATSDPLAEELAAAPNAECGMRSAE